MSFMILKKIYIGYIFVLILLNNIVIGDEGVIECVNGFMPGPCSGGNCYQIPTHRVLLKINGQECNGPFMATNCEQMIGKVHDGYKKFSCGKKIDFWITDNQCMNIEYDGQHHYCCIFGACKFT